MADFPNYDTNFLFSISYFPINMTNYKDAQWVFNQDREAVAAGPGVTRKVMAYSDEAMCVLNYFEEGAVGALHSHPHTQITFVAEGKFRFTIGDEEKVVSQGDTLQKRHGVSHGCRCLEKGLLVDFFTPMREDFV
jgi:quercetin dioxygenase-like cupin family protein